MNAEASAVLILVPILSALAWPLAALAIAALFRRELRLALNRLVQLKYGGMEVRFRDDLREAEALVRALPPAPGPGGPSGPAATVRFEVAADAGPGPAGVPLIEAGAEAALEPEIEPGPARARGGDRRPPRDAILRAWDDLARALVEAAGRLGDRRNPVPSRIEPALRFLVARGYLGGDEGRLVDQLRRLADQVDRPDGPAPGRAEADRFAALIRPVRDRLAGLA